MKKKATKYSAFFKVRVGLSLLLCFAGITLVLFALGKASAQMRTGPAPANPFDGATGKIAPWVIEHTENGQQAEFFVVLADQANLNDTANLETKDEKARFVYETL